MGGTLVLISSETGHCLSFAFYRPIELPALDYGIAAVSTVADEACKELSQVQRAALLKATGCLSNTLTEVITATYLTFI